MENLKSPCSLLLDCVSLHHCVCVHSVWELFDRVRWFARAKYGESKMDRARMWRKENSSHLLLLYDLILFLKQDVLFCLCSC